MAIKSKVIFFFMFSIFTVLISAVAINFIENKKRADREERLDILSKIFQNYLVKKDVYFLKDDSWALFRSYSIKVDSEGTRDRVDVYYKVIDANKASAEIGVVIYKSNYIYYCLDYPSNVIILAEDSDSIYTVNDVSRGFYHHSLILFVLQQSWRDDKYTHSQSRRSLVERNNFDVPDIFSFTEYDSVRSNYPDELD